jgi:hypothetical protein
MSAHLIIWPCQDAPASTIADLVLQVSDVSRKDHGNRSFRKRLDRQYLAD